MIIDDEKKLIDLFMDNVIWGNITIDLTKWNVPDDKHDKIAIAEALGTWIGNHRDNVDMSHETISTLYRFFTVGRITDVIHGELRDRDEEAKIRELESHNQQLAEHLSKAYVPSKDNKIGMI